MESAKNALSSNRLRSNSEGGRKKPIASNSGE